MKRTLTDEQVRIFRHSEIHSILRERRAQGEDSGSGDVAPVGKKDEGQEQKAQDGQDVEGPAEYEGVDVVSKRPSGQESHSGIRTGAAHGSPGTSAQRTGSRNHRDQHVPDAHQFKRRLVSYADY